MDKETTKELEHGYRYAKEAMNWYGWDSPVGLGLGLVSIGVFLWPLHLANLLK